jgi:hypothetical protein
MPVTVTVASRSSSWSWTIPAFTLLCCLSAYRAQHFLNPNANSAMSTPNALKEVSELKDGCVRPRHCVLGYTRSSNDPIHKHDVQVAAALIIKKISGRLPRYGG